MPPLYTLHHGDCLDVLRSMAEGSVSAVVTDPPYGLEFMGKDWDRLDGDAWRTGGTFTKPGIGEREIEWPSYGAGDTANATCQTCGGRMRGKNRCACEAPEWRVKGKPLESADVDSRQAQGRKMQAWHEQWAREVFRVLKPGGHLLAFGGTRTYHRMACAIEDAGFEVRDSLHWIYGSGFPKSLNIGNGRGTALKPSHEPIIVARKPLAGTVAANVEKHGTGALNIDGTRVGFASDADRARATLTEGRATGKPYSGLAGIADERASFTPSDNSAGRWPPNVLLAHAEGCGEACAEDCAVAEIDRQSGTQTSSASTQPRGRRPRGMGEVGERNGDPSPNGPTYSDSGGASRFFPVFKYQAKAARSEREQGCADLPARTGAAAVEREEGSAGTHSPRAGAGRTAKQVRNHHPTVKPVALMAWLVRLVTPPGATVLDPFMGSGTTGMAALAEGFDFIGIERDPEYIEIARARIEHAAAGQAGLGRSA